MHDLYYKGRIHTRLNHVNAGYKTNRDIRLGTKERPLSLIVSSEDRKTEVQLTVKEHQLAANFIVDEAGQENLSQLTAIIDKHSPTTFEQRLGRNDPCSCASGKKYKKCCG